MLTDNNGVNDTFNLWSAEKFDLSLDSFSKDLLHEFDKAGQGLLLSRNNTSDKKSKSILQDAPMVNGNAIIDSLPGSSIRTSQLTATTATTSSSTEENASLQGESIEDGSKVSNSVRTAQQELQKDSGVALEKSLITNDEAESVEGNRNDSSCAEGSNQTTASSFLNSATVALSRDDAVAEDHKVQLQYHNVDEIGKIVSKQYPPKPLQYSPVDNLPSPDLSPERSNLNIRKSISLSRKKSSITKITLGAASKETEVKNKEITAENTDFVPLQRLITNHNNTSPTTTMNSSPFSALDSAAPSTQKPKRRFFSHFLFCY